MYQDGIRTASYSVKIINTRRRFLRRSHVHRHRHHARRGPFRNHRSDRRNHHRGVQCDPCCCLHDDADADGDVADVEPEHDDDVLDDAYDVARCGCSDELEHGQSSLAEYGDAPECVRGHGQDNVQSENTTLFLIGKFSFDQSTLLLSSSTPRTGHHERRNEGSGNRIILSTSKKVEIGERATN